MNLSVILGEQFFIIFEYFSFCCYFYPKTLLLSRPEISLFLLASAKYSPRLCHNFRRLPTRIFPFRHIDRRFLLMIAYHNESDGGQLMPNVSHGVSNGL